MSAAPAAAATAAIEALPSEAPAAEAQRDYSFTDMNLHVGTRLQIELQRGGKANRHMVSLIGYLQGKSLLVTVPLANLVSLPMVESERLVVRVFSGTSAYAFVTWVERISAAPYPYMHLVFPEKVFGTEIRKVVRVKVNLPVEIRAAHDQPGVAARIIDISTRGALIESAQELGKVQERLRLAFAFRPGEDESEAKLVTEAVIQNVRAGKSEAAPGTAMVLHGVNFDKLTENDAILLQALVWHTLYRDRSALD